MITTYFKNKLQDYIFLNQSLVMPSAFYLGLSKTQPNNDGSGIVEPNGGDYTRIELTRSSNDFTTSVNGVVKNKQREQYNETTTVWGLCTHYVVYDAPTGGNVLFYGELENSRNVDIEMQLFINPNDLSFELS